MTDQDRAAFETWRKTIYTNPEYERVGDEYHTAPTQCAWLGWQAAHDYYAPKPENVEHFNYKLFGKTLKEIAVALDNAPKLTEKDRLEMVAAINAAIGYVSSIKPGTVITEDFVERWNSYYLPRLESALHAAGLQFEEA